MAKVSKSTADEVVELEESVRTSGLLSVAGAFFLAELGDKTMLVTITLATSAEPWGTCLGSTAGMVAADAIAIAICHLWRGPMKARLAEAEAKAAQLARTHKARLAAAAKEAAK